MSEKMIKLTLKKSLSGRLKKHQATVATLGLRRIGASVLLKDLPSLRGKIKQVSYLLEVENSQ